MTTALEQALTAIADFPAPDEESQLIAAKVRGLVIGYDHRWRDAGWVTESTEEVFILPVINPETGAKSRTFAQAGKFDGIVTRDSRKYLLEHKTTSEDVADPNSPYWRRLTIDSQVSSYVLAKWQQGDKLDGTLYDVIKKPGIRPKEIAKADLQHILTSRSYFGFEVPEPIQNRLINTVKPRECGELYAMRLASECIENPDKYFQRRVVPRLDSDIAEYAQELWDVSQSVIESRRRNAHYRNSGACMEYNTPCRFLGICSGFDSPDSDRWRKAESVHDELPAMELKQLDLLTNSRVRCFQSCRRKHLYHYEMGIRRVDEEERETLVLGSLLHRALEGWWNFFLKGTEDVCSETVAVGTEPTARTTAAEA